MVANSRSSEAFIAACLLTVGGSSLLTKQMGLSDTLGAFVAGVLLSETSFRTQVSACPHPVDQPAATCSLAPGLMVAFAGWQHIASMRFYMLASLIRTCHCASWPDLLAVCVQVEADIRPFRGLLIGLFFLSVGGSINMEVLKDNYDVILWMLAGLVSLKAAVNTMLGPLFGLSK